MEKTFNIIAQSAEAVRQIHDEAVAALDQQQHKQLMQHGRLALNLVQQWEPEIYKAMHTMYEGNPTNMAIFLMTRQTMFNAERPIDLLAQGKANDIRAKLSAANSGNHL